MADATKCDRCGKVSDTDYILPYVEFYVAGEQPKHCDLCDKCELSFLEWMVSPPRLVHGFNCAKREHHWARDYGHDDEDDYLHARSDGRFYCGRCHNELTPEEAQFSRKREES